jgi:hypothetical protein
MNEERTSPNQKEIFKSFMLAYLILGLHVVLIAVVVLLVFVIRGFIEYAFWIFLGVLALAAFSGYRIWRRIKREKKSLRDTLNRPPFRGRSVEISLLGGMAQFRLGAQQKGQTSGELEQEESAAPAWQLEDAETSRIRKLSELARLLENDLITREEYEQEKHRLLNQ